MPDSGDSFGKCLQFISCPGNGPEFISKSFVNWCNENGIRILYIQPGKPVQNALIERFNRLFREDVLDAYIFEDIHQVREISKEWNTNSKYLVFLTVENESELHKLLQKIQIRDLKYSTFTEPDIGDQLTAIALEPG